MCVGTSKEKCKSLKEEGETPFGDNRSLYVSPCTYKDV